MSLQLIIKEIKVVGKILQKPQVLDQDGQQLHKQLRKYRVKIGDEQFISRRFGEFISENQLIFDQPFSYIFDNKFNILYIQFFKQHHYLDNSDLDEILVAQVDLSDLTNLHGDYVEVNLKNINEANVGKMILSVQTFKKGRKFAEKVSSHVFFQAVKQQKQRQIQASQAAKNIKNLMVNNAIGDTQMSISNMTLIPQKQDTQIFMRQGFIMVRYGMTIKAFSSILKMSNKQGVNWVDFMQFLKNQGVKFQFFFFHYDDLGNLICKSKGQIRYIIFDQTINMHSIDMMDKKSNKYATLMVKFHETNVDKVTINNKIDKKIKEIEPAIQQSIEQFNKYRFQVKNNNHILSQKLWEEQQRVLAQKEQKQKPLNPEQKKLQNQHGQFINFLQKEMIRLSKESVKKQQHQKADQRHHMFLPTVGNKKAQEKDNNKLVGSQSMELKSVKLPKI